MAAQIVDTISSRLGSKLGLDIGYLLRNGNWVTMRFLVATATGFLLSLVFARFGEKMLLGQYQFVLSVMSITSIFSLLGLNAAALEAVAQGREAAVFRASRSIFRASLFGLLLIVMAGVYTAFFKNEGDTTLGLSLITSGVLFPIFYATSSWSSFYEGKLLFKESSLKMIGLNVVLTSLLVGMVFFNVGLIALVMTYAMVTILFQGTYLSGLRKKISKQSSDALDTRFGIAVSFQKSVSGLSTNIPPLMLSFYFGLELLAIYYIAYYAVAALSSFLNNLMSLYLPALFKKTALNHKGILFNSFLSGVVTLFIFLIFLKVFFLPIYGREYAESLRLAYLLSPLLILAPFHTYLVSFFSIRRRNSFLIKVFCFSNIVGLAILHLIHGLGFVPSTAVYIIFLECATVFPLIIAYFRTQIRQSTA